MVCQFSLLYCRKFNERELSKQRLREAGRLSDSEDNEEFDGGLKVPGRIWSKLYKYAPQILTFTFKQKQRNNNNTVTKKLC